MSNDKDTEPYEPTRPGMFATPEGDRWWNPKDSETPAIVRKSTKQALKGQADKHEPTTPHPN